ncbi:hypothetical protein E1A91_A11G158800v1 [Gossypium mustelinum]|uniref:Uncharacterized protein n=1 Tax=Gossypium mustelinum TaxID=34275 RepID=A0A5D2X7D2_GOSMU|nr:hypothetical protein E1A91_A11G158800v1 [Gossypium mustelinum]
MHVYFNNMLDECLKRVLNSLVLLIKRQECERGAAKRRKDKELVDEDRESCTVELSDHSDDDDEVEADTVVSVEKKVDFLGFSILSKHANYLKIIYQKEATFMDDGMKAGFRLDCIDFCTSKAPTFLFMEANKTQLKTEMKEVTQKIASSQKELELKEDGETELKKQFEAISEFSSNSSSPLSCIVD